MVSMRLFNSIFTFPHDFGLLVCRDSLRRFLENWGLRGSVTLLVGGVCCGDSQKTKNFFLCSECAEHWHV